MPRTINIGQFYGGLIGAAVWVLAAIWCLYFWPRSLRRRIDRGDIDAFAGLAMLRKAPLFGYFLLLLAIFDAIGTLDYVGAFGNPRLGIVLLFAWSSACSLWFGGSGDGTISEISKQT